MTAAPCAKVKAPQVAESPVSIECKVKSVTSYGTHDMFLAEIVAVNVEEDFIDEKGRLDLEKAGLVAYAHGHYYTLGRNLGGFGFSVNKERLKKGKKRRKKRTKGPPSHEPPDVRNRLSAPNRRLQKRRANITAS